MRLFNLFVFKNKNSSNTMRKQFQGSDCSRNSNKASCFAPFSFYASPFVASISTSYSCWGFRLMTLSSRRFVRAWMVSTPQTPSRRSTRWLLCPDISEYIGIDTREKEKIAAFGSAYYFNYIIRLSFFYYSFSSVSEYVSINRKKKKYLVFSQDVILHIFPESLSLFVSHTRIRVFSRRKKC